MHANPANAHGLISLEKIKRYSAIKEMIPPATSKPSSKQRKIHNLLHYAQETLHHLANVDKSLEPAVRNAMLDFAGKRLPPAPSSTQLQARSQAREQARSQEREQARPQARAQAPADFKDVDSDGVSDLKRDWGSDLRADYPQGLEGEPRRGQDRQVDLQEEDYREDLQEEGYREGLAEGMQDREQASVPSSLSSDRDGSIVGSKTEDSEGFDSQDGQVVKDKESGISMVHFTRDASRRTNQNVKRFKRRR